MLKKRVPDSTQCSRLVLTGRVDMDLTGGFVSDLKHILVRAGAE